MSSPLEKPAAVLHSADAPSTRSSDHKAINQKQISRYAAELNRTLSSLESTSRQDWATQSSILSQLTKVLDSHRSVVGSVPLPDPLRFCRALWGALDPQSVLGVQRKALDVLSRYVEYAVAMPLDDSSTSSVSHDPLTEDFPYLLIGVMELFPLCSLQVKPDLLQFIEHLIRALPPQQVRMCLFGVLSTVLQAMEEAEGSGVFRRASSLLRYIREKVSRLTAVVKNDSHFHDGKEGRSVSPPPPIPTTATSAAAVTAPMARGGGEAFFANLWVILRDCPGLRGATLVFLKAILAEEEENLLSRGTYIKRQTNGVDGEECQEEDAENSFQGYTGALEEELDARRLEWLGGPNGAHSLVHPAFLLCLQDRSGKTQRLALDLLVAYFPLECHPADSEAYGPTKVYLSSAFSFHDMSLLVVAALQLLGLPGETTGVLRRIAAWLCGPHPESTDQYIEQTTGFIISHSFYGVKQWWQRRFFNKSVGDLSPSARCLSRSDGLQSSAALTVEAKETDYTLDALYTSGSNALSIALDQFHRGVMGPTACDSRVLLLARAERTLLDHEMPAYIWWCAMLRLLQHTMAADHNDDDVNVSMDASSTPQSGSCGGVSRPFMAHVAPLIATNFFEWLVCLSAMQSSHLIQGMQESPLDAIIGNVFVELPWPLITQYETGLLTLIHKVAALVANSCDENHSPPSSPTGVAGVASHDNWDEIQHQAELWLSQLHGFTEVLLIHVMAHARSAPERAVPFFSDTFDVCRLLAKISLKAATGLCSLTALAQQPLSLAALEGKELSYRLVEGPLQLFRLQCSGVLSGLHDRLAASTEAVSAAHISDASLAGRLESEVLVPYFIPMPLMLLKSATGSASSTETLPILLEAFGEVFKTCCEVILLADQLRTRGRCGVDHGDVQEQHSPKRDQLASWLTEIATSIPTASPEAAVAMLPLVLRVRGLTGCPSALKMLIENETIMVPIVHSMWDLSNSGAVSADLKFAAVQLLLDLIDIDTGKKAIDALMLRNSSENCERIIDVMNHLAHRRGLGTAHSVLFTGYCTLLASLVDASSPAHNMSVQYFARRAPSDLLSPILNSFLQGTDISDVTSLHIKKKPSSKGELMNLHQRDGRNPVYSFIEADELVRYVSALLLLPSAQEWVEAAGSTPAPADMATLLQKLAETSTSFSNSPTAAAKNRDAEDGIPSKALLGILAGALFLILRQSIISFQATSACAKEENQTNNDNSLTEAPNLFSPLVCLNKLVEYTPPDSAASMPTWRYTSVRCVPLLQIAVELEMVTSQILLLAHLQVTTQFLSVSGHGRLQSAAMLATLPNALEYVNRPCPHALSLPSLYRTIEEGVRRCVDNPSGVVRVDLLRSWANFLVDLLPVLGKQLVSASHTIIHVLLHVCENTRQQQLIAPSPQSSFSINDTAHAKIQSLCDLSLHRVLVYVYAVAGVVDAANSAFAQKTLNQMGWFSTFSSNAEDTSTERSLWQRSAICEPCRKLLTRLVLHSIPAMGAPLEIRPTASQLMQLLHNQAGLELVNTFVTVWEKRWAASEVCIRGQRPSRNLRLRSTSAAAAAATPLREDVRGQQNAASTDALEHHSTEGAAMLLVQSTGATFLTIARAVDRLLLQSAATISDVTAASSTPASRVRSAASPSGSAPLPRETLYLYFLHQLMAAHRDKLKSEDIGVMMDIFSRLLTAGAPCYLSMASMYRSMHLMHSIAPSEFQGLFVDKRFTFIICRTLECLGSIPIYNSPDPDNHLFAIEVVSSLTPCFIPSLNALDGNQRVVDAVALLFTRTAFPTLRFGIESSSESDVISRTPSVITILRMILFIVKFSDTVARRVRGDLLELCSSEWFFRFPSTALHEWAVLWERLTHDRGFLSMSREKFSAPSNKLASIMTSFETEALQRSRQLKCLAFSTLAMPAAAAGDRDYITFIKEQVTTVLEVYSSSAIPTIGDLNSHKVMLQPVRMVLLLVRILLTKVNDALLSSFWPIIVPEMMRAMQMQYAADMLAGERSEVESGLSKREQRKQRMNTILDVRTQLEVFALQAEVLKLIDFAVTICPDRFTTFRWLFSDDTQKCAGNHVGSGWTPFFVPMMEGTADVSAHANTQELKRGGQKNQCPLAQERIAPVDDKISPGFTRPFLRIPETHYRRFSGIGVLVAALAQHYDFMKDPDVRTCFAHHHRRNDYWDKSYVRSLLLADLSLVDPDTSL